MSPTSPTDHHIQKMAEHDLLTSEQELALAKAIEVAETAAWFDALSLRSRAVDILLDSAWVVRQARLGRLKKALAGPSVGPAAQKHLRSATREAANELRRSDPDRARIDAVVALADDPDLARASRVGRDLRDKFIRANLRLVVAMAHRHDRGGMPLSDLIQEGSLGLMQAVSKYDYRRGLRFSTYACWWIRHAISRALADKGSQVRIPVHMREALHKLDRVRQELTAKLRRPPTVAELAKAGGVSPDRVDEMLSYALGPATISLDAPRGSWDDGASRETVGDSIPDPGSEDSRADELNVSLLADQVGHLLHHLAPIEADVIRRRFGMDCGEQTFREIGDVYSLSRERIRQIQNEALVKLKRALQKEHRGTVEP